MKLNIFKKKILPDTLKKVQVGLYALWANQEHPIQEYLTLHKHYSRNLPRLAKYIEDKYPTYTIIDIGANIGDSVALIRSADVNQHIYCVEGESAYYKLLQRNVEQFTHVTTIESFLGENEQTAAIAAQVSQGTAKLSHQAGKQIIVQKLDDLVNTHQISAVKLLKIDTDGFDFKILRGGFNLIANEKPVLFFEYDAVYLEEQGEHGTEIFEQLKNFGYNQVIYYDNYGKLLISITTQDTSQIKQLYNYMRRHEGAFPYYDIAIFHQDDDALADQIISQETDFFK
jgi:FkbM family methyltransferase